MRISDWSSDVCSSDLFGAHEEPPQHVAYAGRVVVGVGRGYSGGHVCRRLGHPDAGLFAPPGQFLRRGRLKTFLWGFGAGRRASAVPTPPSPWGSGPNQEDCPVGTVGEVRVDPGGA